MNKTRAKVLLKSATAITSAYTGWVSSWIDVTDAEMATVLLTIVKGSETSILLIVEHEDVTETTGYRMQKIASGAASDDELTITSDSLAATDYVAIPLQVQGSARIRVKAKYSGGSAPGTVAAHAMLGGAR